MLGLDKVTGFAKRRPIVSTVIAAGVAAFAGAELLAAGIVGYGIARVVRGSGPAAAPPPAEHK